MRKHVLHYFWGDLCDEEGIIQGHLGTCPECRKLLEEFEGTGRVLARRRLPRVPRGLGKACLQRIERETGGRERIPVLEGLFDLFSRRPRLVLRWAVLGVVFCGGLGLGKLLFDPPRWFERYENVVRDRGSFAWVQEKRSLRNYFLSVETLFLDLTNMENPASLDEEEWEMEREIAHEILSRTRRMKGVLGDKDPELCRLLSEIEWVLEDLLGMIELDLAELPGEVRQGIDERGLLAKIHDYVS